MTNNINISPSLQRIIAEDAVGQLRRRDGRMATLGSENGELKLDWVEGVARLLADPALLEMVVAEAQNIWQRGIRHIIWAGMGGSVLTVRVLTSLGFCSASSERAGSEQITIYPLDSTDPAALNAIVQQIAGAKEQRDDEDTRGQGDREDRPYPVTEQWEDQTFLHALFADVLMIGVSMGMTSEEPITHLTWFADLLARVQLPVSEHVMVMTLPGSYLDQFAQERSAPSLSLQPDGGTGTGGRMSAPTTRVFLLPVALSFVHQPHPSGQLRDILRQAWEWYDLDLASSQTAQHPFVQLAAAISEASQDGACLLPVQMPPGWETLVSWLEQLMEESLGKGGKGVVVFKSFADSEPVHGKGGGGVDVGRGPLRSPSLSNEHTEKGGDGVDAGRGPLRLPSLSNGHTEKDEGDRKGPLPSQHHPRPYYDYEGDLSGPLRSPSLLRVYVTTDTASLVPESLDTSVFTLSQPYLATTDAGERLAALAASFLGWQLSMALFGYLHDITFAGQPAVENYKARARVLRMQENPLSVLVGWNAQCSEGILTLYGPQGTLSQASGESLAHSFAKVLKDAYTAQQLTYLDGTINGEASPAWMAVFEQYMQRISNVLRVPVKLRRAPADYHSTEQSEMDGPPSLVSLRLLSRQHERCVIGQYDDTFLCAQAVSTWQAMLEQGRSCFLLVVDGTYEDAVQTLTQFFERVISILNRNG